VNPVLARHAQAMLPQAAIRAQRKVAHGIAVQIQ
jgi:hypothetical protein